MNILISIKDAKEAKELAQAKGVDIIDIKNPLEGTLGANYPWVIEDIKPHLPNNAVTAASIGDLDFKPGSASLAAHGAATLNVNYITASMYRFSSKMEIEITIKSLLKTLEEFSTGLIVAAYADYERCGSPDPLNVLSASGNADYFMLDTAIKDGKNILNFLKPVKLIKFKEQAHRQGIKLIIAGSIRYPQLEEIKKIKADVIGFRGIVCQEGEVKAQLVEKLVRTLK